VIYHASTLAVVVFALFVAAVLALSLWLGSRTKSSGGYFAAHGQVGWFVNGIAFAGDYLSAASFLGICGMIAFFGYDGFLYSIGYLAGWIVALFVIAEPVKRLGKYTLADALDSKFNSRGLKLVAAISTLVISLFYLVPQMVGAGALVKPLSGAFDALAVASAAALVQTGSAPPPLRPLGARRVLLGLPLPRLHLLLNVLPGRDAGEVGAAWYMGAPLVVGDDLFVLVESGGQLRLDVLDAARGVVRWSQPLADLDEHLHLFEEGDPRAGGVTKLRTDARPTVTLPLSSLRGLRHDGWAPVGRLPAVRFNVVQGGLPPSLRPRW
jgi:hypothetical protein